MYCFDILFEVNIMLIRNLKSLKYKYFNKISLELNIPLFIFVKAMKIAPKLNFNTFYEI